MAYWRDERGEIDKAARAGRATRQSESTFQLSSLFVSWAVYIFSSLDLKQGEVGNCLHFRRSKSTNTPSKYKIKGAKFKGNRSKLKQCLQSVSQQGYEMSTPSAENSPQLADQHRPRWEALT